MKQITDLKTKQKRRNNIISNLDDINIHLLYCSLIAAIRNDSTDVLINNKIQGRYNCAKQHIDSGEEIAIVRSKHKNEHNS